MVIFKASENPRYELLFVFFFHFAPSKISSSNIKPYDITSSDLLLFIGEDSSSEKSSSLIEEGPTVCWFMNIMRYYPLRVRDVLLVMEIVA
jgi:hypothetical protein